MSHLRARRRGRVLRDPAKAFLGLGSNQGDRARMLARARDLLAGPDLHIARASHVYESAPWGVTDQPWFLNQVLEVRTALAPHPLLERCRGVETRLGRVRSSRWGPRTIDVDILLYDDVVMSTAALTIPHRRLRDRAFVLIPLAEIDPGLRLPGGERIADLLAGLPDQGSVRAFLVPAGEDGPAVADAMPSPRMPE